MKDVVLTPRGPKPIGPYSQAIKANGFIFVSGQIALDPQTGEFAGTDVRLQTERVMENVKADRGGQRRIAQPRGEEHRIPEGHE